ncbi:hypothetical protein AK95_14420 [Paenibacillus sp. LC231]|uniref:LytTR family transcriptional regulator DNA-binding domain-containing protein n=1 Tax=Paenibacillus sp. LC231 TaxID=1120679 RepID=UPI0008DDA7C4|nr:LytTR family transcriptional regulator DNA-binding domain-containing protein [Paenibacillus sp. LC231]OIB04811.1 hypothetical protein AK95_14420 [Paenibacillus sp. LC231]
MDLELQMSKQTLKQLESLLGMIRIKKDWTLVNIANVAEVDEANKTLSFSNGEELKVDPEYWDAFITKFRSRQ